MSFRNNQGENPTRLTADHASNAVAAALTAEIDTWNDTNRETLNAGGDAAHCPPVILVVVAVCAWADGRTQAQVVGVVGRGGRRRPVVAVRATMAHRTTEDAAGIDEIVRIASKCCSSSFTS